MSRVRIGLLLQGGATWVGGFEYIRNLAFALQRLRDDQALDFDLHLLSPRPLDPFVHGELAAEGFVLRVLDAPPSDRQTYWRERGERFLRGSNPRLHTQLNDAPYDFVYPYFAGYRPQADFPYASWIADFQHRHLPQLFSLRQRLARDWAFRLMARQAPQVVLSSEDARGDFQRFFPQAQARARVLRFCTPLRSHWLQDDARAVADAYELPARYFMVCNQFWSHKNHLALFRAIAQLRRALPDLCVVCTGKLEEYRDPTYTQALKALLEAEGLEAHVKLLGLIPRSDQVQLMRRALAIVQPSRFEGWSTVVEDAKALGKTLILSNLAVHREQAPPFAHFFHPNDVGLLAEHMRALWLEGAEGHDPQREAQAQAANEKKVLDYANSFLDIAGFSLPSLRRPSSSMPSQGR